VDSFGCILGPCRAACARLYAAGRAGMSAGAKIGELHTKYLSVNK
jgi:hypothetical protein